MNRDSRGMVTTSKLFARSAKNARRNAVTLRLSQAKKRRGVLSSETEEHYTGNPSNFLNVPLLLEVQGYLVIFGEVSRFRSLSEHIYQANPEKCQDPRDAHL